MSDQPAPLSRLGRVSYEYRYGYVLALVVVLITVALVVPEGAWGRLLLVVLQALTVVAATWAGNATRRVRQAAVLLGLVAGFGALARALGAETGEDISMLAVVPLVLMTPLVMLGGLARALRDRGVTLQVILGAVAIYLLIGILCAGIYTAIARLDGQPLFAAGNGDGTTSERYYFSFVTQATVGYGDYTLERAGARAVAVWQAVAGQLYLVTIVALLVGRLGRVRESGGAGGGAGAT